MFFYLSFLTASVYHFTIIKVKGQWIVKPPSFFEMLEVQTLNDCIKIAQSVMKSSFHSDEICFADEIKMKLR